MNVKALVKAAQAALREGNALVAQRQVEALVRTHTDNVPAWNTLGEARVAQELWESAEDAFWQVVRLTPDTWQGWYNLLVCASRGKRADAVAASRYRILEAVASTQPGLAGEERVKIIIRTVSLLKDFGPSPVAELAARRWLDQGGGDEAARALALSLNSQGKFEPALDLWRQLLERHPDNAADLGCLGAALAGSDRFEDAVDVYRQVLRLDPQNIQVMHNMMYALQFCGDQEEGLRLLDLAIEIAPQVHASFSARGMLRLRAGRYREGYADYEHRLQTFVSGSAHYGQTLALRDQGVPLWSGEPLAGKRLFVCPEQGFGDFIMCVRLLPLLKRLEPASLAFGCTSGLERYARALPLDGISFVESVRTEDMDCYVSLLSLMHRAGLAHEQDIPAPLAPVLDVDTVQAWAMRRQDLAAGGAGVRLVGLAWQGNATHPAERYRSIAFADFVEGVVVPLQRLAGIRLVSLQRDMSETEARTLSGIGVETAWIGACADWYDTAALVSGLDGVMSVDTALIHLSATLGVPAIMLNRIATAADWRWLLGRADSPWYPSLRIVSQERRGHWDSAMRQGVEMVSRLLQGATQQPVLGAARFDKAAREPGGNSESETAGCEA